HGPIVSEVGNTWVTSLAKMNALRAFNEQEIEAIGGPEAFIPATWRHDAESDEPIWSIPWLAESRVILYRRDLLEEVGIAEETAFDTLEHLESTLMRLQDSGICNPLILPTNKTANTLHNLPSWIWGEGGDFVDSKHRRVTFTTPSARTGIQEYFGLYRFLAPELYGLDPYQAEAKFITGEAAVTFNGPWTVFLLDEQPQPNYLDKIGVALLPGISCVLASDLVVWKHTPVRQERIAVELVQFLTGREAQLHCPQQTGLLPARFETLSLEPFSIDPRYQVFVNALKSGRSLPVMRLWGLIEERLTVAFANLWDQILQDPDPDLDAIIQAELNPLAQKLNRILQ
ncbi:MAG: extracellular solute-binding protein, partial [Candidatus Promineifilaceae bacterium]